MNTDDVTMDLTLLFLVFLICLITCAVPSSSSDCSLENVALHQPAVDHQGRSLGALVDGDHSTCVTIPAGDTAYLNIDLEGLYVTEAISVAMETEWETSILG